MAATAAEFALLLEPKLSNIWHDAFEPEVSKFPNVMNIRDMNKNTVTDAKMAGFGSLQSQPDGDSIIYDDPIAPIEQTYTWFTRGLGYRIHERLWVGDLYGEVAALEADLMDSARDDAETSAAELFNNAFGTTTHTGFDSLQLVSTAHTRLDGGANQSNRPATDEALSLSALHNGVIQIHKWVNDRGRPRVHKPRTLLVPTDLMIVADELLSSQQKPGTANNDKNVITRFGIEFLEWEYLTSTTAWFLVCDRHDLNFLWHKRPVTGSEVDFDTETIKRKVRQQYVVGFGEWRGLYGTDGVA